MSEEKKSLFEEFKDKQGDKTKPDQTLKKMSATKVKINGVPIDPKAIYEFETILKAPRPRHQPVASESDIFDGTRMRTIRYIPIAESIYKDEQGDRFENYPQPYVGFYGNTLTAEGKDMRLVEFLLACDDYDGNPHRLSRSEPLFTLVNKEALEEKKSIQHDNEFKALEVVNTTPITDLKPIARVIFNILDPNEKAIKNKLRDKAKESPDLILNNILNPKLKRIYEIQNAMDLGVISVNPDKNNAVWADTGTQICVVKEGKNTRKAAEELATFSFTKGDGEEFLKVLRLKDIKE